ncbi:hypothetical protein ACL07V_05190 [Streptomyces sp. MB22_4]|uniref:hypothetical protein n=1 Tax=Streptomyces sp. MB22_4 TaxID=3383120 RepID=UPI0039A196DD
MAGGPVRRGGQRAGGLAVSVLRRTTDDLHSLVGDRLAALPDVTAAETTVTPRRVKSVSRRGA